MNDTVKLSLLENELTSLNDLYQTKKDRLERRIFKLKAPALKELIGSCYRYRNSYGGSDPRTSWWLYVKVVGIDKYNNLRSEQIQDDKQGRIEFHQDQHFHRGSQGNYKKISRQEYNNAKRKILALARSGKY